MKRGFPGFVLAVACLSFAVSLSPGLKAEDADLAQLRAKAEKGNVLAQYNLGLAYAEGRGVPMDLVEAYVWLRLASENGGTGTALSSVIHQMSIGQIAAGRLRLDERRQATPGLVGDHRAASSAGAPPNPPAAPPPAPTEDRFALMQEEISNLRVDNARLTQQLASLQGSQAKPAASAASLEVQKRLAGREAELEAARKELEAMKSRQDEVERDLRDQLAKAQAENQSLAAAMQRLKGQERTGTELSGQLAEAQSTIEQLKKENAGLQAQRAALADQPAAAPSVPAAAPAGTSDADELARLKDDLKRANSKVEMTVRSFTLLQQENERLKAQLAQARTP